MLGNETIKAKQLMCFWHCWSMKSVTTKQKKSYRITTQVQIVYKIYLKESEKSPTNVSLSLTRNVPSPRWAYCFSFFSASVRPPGRRPWNHFSLKCSSSSGWPYKYINSQFCLTSIFHFICISFYFFVFLKVFSL